MDDYEDDADELEKPAHGPSLGVFAIDLDINGLISYNCFIDEDLLYTNIDKNAKLLAMTIFYMNNTQLGSYLVTYIDNLLNNSTNPSAHEFKYALTKELHECKKNETIVVPASRVFS